MPSPAALLPALEVLSMKIVGGRKFSTKKNQRPMVKRRQRRVKADSKQTDQFLFGSLGAAPPVRKIDPMTGKIVAIISAR
jgi:hypothetical protein